MIKTLLALAMVAVVGFFAVKALIHFWLFFERMEDEDHQHRRDATRDYRDAQADLEHEIDIAERRSTREHNLGEKK